MNPACLFNYGEGGRRITLMVQHPQLPVKPLASHAQVHTWGLASVSVCNAVYSSSLTGSSQGRSPADKQGNNVTELV